MFLLNRNNTGLEKYYIEVEKNLLSTEVTIIDNFYLTPEKVSSYEFDTEETVAKDNRLIPIYKFFGHLLEIDLRNRKTNLLYFSTDNEQNNFDSGSGKYHAIVNFSKSVNNSQIELYRRNNTPIDEEIIDGDGPAPVDDYRIIDDPYIHYANVDKFYLKTFDLNYNQVIIYDPSIFYIKNNFEKYQVFVIY
jgi:hypothetical protein